MDASDARYSAVQKLMAYWLVHPQASDTLQGICQWWLGDASIAATQVEPALQWLVGSGVVVAHQAVDGRVRYRLACEGKGSAPC